MVADKEPKAKGKILALSLLLMLNTKTRKY